jgi:UDP-glucose 4-epimerase
MRILLTGSSGWLGRYLAPMLRANGHAVTGIDVAAGADTQILGSVADAALIDRTFADCGIEAVIHSGALHKPDIARYGAQAFVDVNITGTLNLLEAAIHAGHDRFVFTSTTSLMVRNDVRAGRAGGARAAYWMDEDFGPIAPRNIYGVTKYAAEQLCRLYHARHGIGTMVLRTGRFFPEGDDTIDHPSGPNLKANEFLNRRLTVEDAGRAHCLALARGAALGFETFILSAPPPFIRDDAEALMSDARAVIARYYPDAAAIYGAKGWILPDHIDRVYDPAKAEHLLGWRAQSDFGSILAALSEDRPLPFVHDPAYVSPKERVS